MSLVAGTGDHDRPEWLITINGIREDFRLRAAVEPVMSGFENAVAARVGEIAAYRNNLAATLHGLRERFGEGFEISQTSDRS